MTQGPDTIPDTRNSPGSALADDAALQASYEHCRLVTKARARNFYYGLKLTPQPKRSAMYAVYAWNRAADDLADAEIANKPASPLPASPDAGPSPPVDASAGERPIDAARLARIERFREQSLAALEGRTTPGALAEPAIAPMWPAVSHAFQEYRVPAKLLNLMIEGQLLDQRKRRYADFGELRDYCYKVASVVGLTCIQVWGYEGGAATERLAEARGIALQMTNILRDLVEDARRDRVYLPEAELREFGFTPQRFLEVLRSGREDMDGAFRKLMDFQVDRARRFHEQSAGLERFVEPACRPTCWAMAEIYRRLLERIAADPVAVIRSRIRLSSWEKAGIAIRALWGWA